MANLSLEEKAFCINQHLWPIFGYRCGAWPFQKTIAKHIDSLQVRLVATMNYVARSPIETDARYHSRRCNIASTAVRKTGEWSTKWALATLTWEDHEKRNTSGLLWSSLLSSTRNSTWLQERRALFVPKTSIRAAGWTVLAGKTATRARPGGPAVRWEDGCAAARERIQELQLESRLQKLLNKRQRRLVEDDSE